MLNIWELDEPIATNIQELAELSDHLNYLYNKKVTLCGFTVDYSLYEHLHKITSEGHPEILCFSKCKISNDSFDLFVDLECLNTKLSINNCDLTPKLGIMILESFDAYLPVDMDLSNNKLGIGDCIRFIEHIKKDVRTNLAGFSSINISNNGFSQDIIDDLRNFAKEHKHYHIII